MENGIDKAWFSHLNLMKFFFGFFLSLIYVRLCQSRLEIVYKARCDRPLFQNIVFDENDYKYGQRWPTAYFYFSLPSLDYISKNEPSISMRFSIEGYVPYYTKLITRIKIFECKILN